MHFIVAHGTLAHTQHITHEMMIRVTTKKYNLVTEIRCWCNGIAKTSRLARCQHPPCASSNARWRTEKSINWCCEQNLKPITTQRWSRLSCYRFFQKNAYSCHLCRGKNRTIKTILIDSEEQAGAFMVSNQGKKRRKGQQNRFRLRKMLEFESEKMIGFESSKSMQTRRRVCDLFFAWNY